MNETLHLNHVGTSKTFLLALTLGTALVSQIPAGAQNFVNGSFETGDFTGWTIGASVREGHALFGGVYGAGYDGNYWCWLGNHDYAGSAADPVIQQTISGFTVGKTYTLSFLQSSEAGWYPVPNGDTETTFGSIIGTATLSRSFLSPPSNGTSPVGGGLWNVWQPETWSFVADDSSLTFKIAGNYDPSADVGDTGVDDFKITPNTSVPDSGTTLTLLGMATGGMACFRRKL
jgi:hypothetical protein